MDSHLVAVPGLGALTTRGLAGGDLEDLGGETDGPLDAEVLALGALDQLRRDCIRTKILAFSPSPVGTGTWSIPFSRAWTLQEVKVIRMRWILGPSPNSPFSLL